MKQQRVFLLLFFCCLKVVRAQDVPNNSFQNWSGNAPSSWLTNEQLYRISDTIWTFHDTTPRDNDSSAVVLKSDTFLAISNESAVIPASLILGKLRHTTGSEEAFLSPVAYSHKPDTLYFDYRYLPASGTDSASFQFIFSQGDSILLNIAEKLGVQLDWRTKTVVLTSLYSSSSLKPDSLFVQFRSSANNANGQIGSRLWIDNIRLRVDSSALPVGITTVLDDKISVYPNPASDFLIVDLDEPLANGYLLLHDLQGRLFHKQKAVIGKNTINSCSFAEGIYLLSVSGASETVVSVYKRILITR